MPKSDVIFGIANTRVPWRYDRSQLRDGAIIHVSFDKTGNPESFAGNPSADSTPHVVTSISPSEWYVTLESGFRIEQELVNVVSAVLQGYMDENAIRFALDLAAKDIRLEHLHKTSEYKRSRLSVVSTVAHRLELVSRLRQRDTAKDLFHHYEALVTYLLLTCFDRLGQPADWLEFGSWLSARGKKDEREKASQGINATDPVEVARAMHDFYKGIYAVKHAFFKFLTDTKLLPAESRQMLLASIDIVEMPNTPGSGLERSHSEKEKMEYLYGLRNNYTHEARFIRGVAGMTYPEDWDSREVWVYKEQEFKANSWVTVAFRDWPGILESTVRTGLMVYLQSIADVVSVP
ncbi:MAG: hypothetical protein HY318_03340 [Armatimonadetes bacterium]|nr:hypothetical protein [Armatimonadota bacterium]